MHNYKTYKVLSSEEQCRKRNHNIGINNYQTEMYKLLPFVHIFVHKIGKKTMLWLKTISFNSRYIKDFSKCRNFSDIANQMYSKHIILESINSDNKQEVFFQILIDIKIFHKFDDFNFYVIILFMTIIFSTSSDILHFRHTF